MGAKLFNVSLRTFQEDYIKGKLKSIIWDKSLDLGCRSLKYFLASSHMYLYLSIYLRLSAKLSFKKYFNFQLIPK